MKNIRTEFQKLRRRHLGLLFLAAFGLIVLWTLWAVNDLDLTKLNDTTALLTTNLLLMNTILSPLLLAVTASRMCDMEQAGNTYTWIFTMQTPSSFLDSKLAAGIFYMLVFDLGQFFFLIAMDMRFLKGFQLYHLEYLLSIFAVHLFLFLLQLLLSLRYENQLLPLFISIGGTFAGLFSWFLNRLPLRYIIPWGYFAALCNTGMNYDRATRYTEYYWTSYPLIWLAVLLLCTFLLYHFGKRRFARQIDRM